MLHGSPCLETMNFAAPVKHSAPQVWNSISICILHYPLIKIHTGRCKQVKADELQKYPEIGLEWKEPGMAFRVTFVKKNYVVPISRDENDQVSDQVSDQVISILRFCVASKSRGEILQYLGFKNHFDNYKWHIKPALDNNLIEMTIPNKPKSKNQKYRLTNKGKQTLKMIRENTSRSKSQ